MTLHFQDFDTMLNYVAGNDSLRINFSPNNLIYSLDPLIIDYPFLGGCSFTEKVTMEMYKHIQESAKMIIGDFENIKIRQK